MANRLVQHGLAVLAFWGCVVACAHPQPGLRMDDTPMSDKPGSIVSASPLHVDDAIQKMGATATRVTYRSTGPGGSTTEVTGALFVPSGEPPYGGWPVIAFAHGTTGIDTDCGPSSTPDLMGSSGLVAAFLQLGYAVAATDYQGLGGPGEHPYLDSDTAGLNVIDSVRALRETSPDVSRKWGVFGGSQGGGAAWAANELTAGYAPELSLVGAVSLAPSADIAGLAAAAEAGTLTQDQIGLYIWMLIGLERTRPGFTIDDYRHGLAAQEWSTLSACSGAAGALRLQVIDSLTPQDLRPATPAATQALTDILTAMALPQQRASAPMLVIYGGRDTFIDPQWTQTAIDRACRLGSRIAAIYQPEKGHADLDPSQFSGYLLARFDGLPAPSTC